ncbi:MAG: sensor histidine kinase [Halanaerobiaceae bacterium]
MTDKKNFDLEKILKKAVDVLEESRNDMFNIYNSSRAELTNIKNEIKLINRELNEIIQKIEKKKKKNRKYRLKLMEVSRDTEQFDEEDIKRAYKEAEDSSVEIGVLKEKEEQLKNQRSKLEKRVNNIEQTVKKSEDLVSRVSVVKDYLHGELDTINSHFDDLRQKKEVGLKIIQAQEKERKRVAREIHDGPAQSMANLNFRFEFISKVLEQDKEKAQKELEELKSIVSQSVKDVRKIIYDLRPMALDDMGLMPTLKKYIKKFDKQSSDLEIDFKIRGEKKSLPEGYQITIFRLIQESLNNIQNHARASWGRVVLEYAEKYINIMIEDDGRGFEMEEVENDRFGLVSMRERCELLEGKFEIQSKPGMGTKIKISIPLDGRKK